MSEWQEYKLNELIEQEKAELQTGPFGTMLSASEYSKDGIPVIAVQDIGDNKLVYHKFVFVDQEVANRLSRYRVKENDIIFGRKGATDRRAIIKKKEEGWLQGSDCIRLRFDDSINSKFISYQLGSKFFKEWMLQFSVGATMPSLNQEILKLLPLRFPSLTYQNSVVEVLSCLDDKIDLLHRQNKTLEQLAETLFRQWFVEEAEESWEVGILENEFDFIMGQSPPGETLNENGDGIIFYQGRTDFGFRFPEPRVYTTASTRIANKFDTLVSVRAPVGDMNIAFERCCLGRGVAAFRFKNNPDFYSFTYYKLRSLMDFIKQFEDSGTVFGSIGKDDFKNLEIIIPPKDMVIKFQEAISPLDEKIYNNTNQIQTLTKLRDTLLPKLMSGEVRVENYE